MTISSTHSTFTRQGSDPAVALQSRIQGQVITPDDPRYEEARLAWNRTVEQRPALIVAAASAADVAEAVKFARAEGLGVAVQSTGHGVTLPADGAMLILTGGLKELRVDERSQTAWVGAGLKWGEVLAETQRHGLAPLLGSSPGVGVVGYTLGGGYGWLGRKYGMAVDSVVAFELVTASGSWSAPARLRMPTCIGACAEAAAALASSPAWKSACTRSIPSTAATCFTPPPMRAR